MITLVGEGIWQVKATAEGASLCIIGGMHGNEKTGIEVVRRLQQEFTNGTRQLTAGTLTLALGNLRAIADGRRYIDGRDLNRYFTPAQLDGIGDGSAEQKRARELAEYVAAADVTVDIHATNKPSVPFVSSKVDEQHVRIYRWFGVGVVLADPNYILAGEPATTDEYADRIGKIGVCVETGNAQDTSRLQEVIQSIDMLMADLGIGSTLNLVVPKAQQKIYTLTETVVLDTRGFAFAEGKGRGSFEPVAAGEVLGYRGHQAVTAATDGVLVFPKLPEHQAIGRPVCYLAVEA